MPSGSEAKNELPYVLPSVHEPLTEQDALWIKYINQVLDDAIKLGKNGDPKKLYGDYQLLLAFFNGDEEKAGNYFMSYCRRVRNCPQDFIRFCEKLLNEAGMELPKRPSFRMPEKLLALQAAE